MSAFSCDASWPQSAAPAKVNGQVDKPKKQSKEERQVALALKKKSQYQGYPKTLDLSKLPKLSASKGSERASEDALPRGDKEKGGEAEGEEEEEVSLGFSLGCNSGGGGAPLCSTNYCSLSCPGVMFFYGTQDLPD